MTNCFFSPPKGKCTVISGEALCTCTTNNSKYVPYSFLAFFPSGKTFSRSHKYLRKRSIIWDSKFNNQIMQTFPVNLLKKLNRHLEYKWLLTEQRGKLTVFTIPDLTVNPQPFQMVYEIICLYSFLSSSSQDKDTNSGYLKNIH